MHFPLFIDISKKNILIIGGGTVADRRVHTLLSFAENITVVAPEYTDAFRQLADQDRIQLLARTFKPEDLTDRDIVLAATNDNVLNREIAFLCRERSIPVNVCSDQTLCDFQFPSVVTDGDVVIGINASGKNHRLVKETRMEIEKIYQKTVHRFSVSAHHPSDSRRRAVRFRRRADARKQRIYLRIPRPLHPRSGGPRAQIRHRVRHYVLQEEISEDCEAKESSCCSESGKKSAKISRK